MRNINQQAFGRREIEIAEQEMPGIMALRKRAADDKVHLSHILLFDKNELTPGYSLRGIKIQFLDKFSFDFERKRKKSD